MEIAGGQKVKTNPLCLGHTKGVLSITKVVQHCLKEKISYLSLFAFSTENWRRSSPEVDSIFNILKKSVIHYEPFLISSQIKLHIIGDLSSMPNSVEKAFQQVKQSTKDNKKLNLILAINYGGRKEIIDGIKKLFSTQKKMNTKEITEEKFASHLSSHCFPDPDLIIRYWRSKKNI